MWNKYDLHTGRPQTGLQFEDLDWLLANRETCIWGGLGFWNMVRTISTQTQVSLVGFSVSSLCSSLPWFEYTHHFPLFSLPQQSPMKEQWSEGDKNTVYCKGRRISSLGDPQLPAVHLYQLKSRGGHDITHLYSSTQEASWGRGLGASASLIT